MTISTQEGVTIDFTNTQTAFRFEGNQLIAAEVLDYEREQTYSLGIICTMTSTEETFRTTVHVLITNMNDNPPNFGENSYHVAVNELSFVGATVGTFPATDSDGNSGLSYTLTSESNDFKLKSPTIPEVLIETRLVFDKIQNATLVLTVQDTPMNAGEQSFTATTTIIVTIVDVDNRPPWFQPCIKHEMGGVVICQSAGYTGRVNLNEQETGVLPLKPGPLFAIDGDTLNAAITYSFLSGHEDGLFEINANTGSISMLKPADVLGTITLTVLAAQTINSDQFATTTVSISVQVKGLHPPTFQKSQYHGVVTSLFALAMDQTNKDEPLQIFATDEDYAAIGGINPHITYSINGSSDFSIINGFLFITKNLPEDTLSMQVLALDTSNDDTATAELSVEVKLGILPLSGYRVADMAALGATLGVLLFVCLVLIGVLVYRLQRGKADWKKIYEASMFQSSLGHGSGDQKKGIQYTNEAFQKDEDGGSMGSGGPDGRSVMTDGESQKAAWDISREEAILRATAPLHNLLSDNNSDMGSDGGDSEKEVKPILTKERRMEEGYKSVWFKEDIDPNAKEEVVIIPDNGEGNSEEEDEDRSSSSRGSEAGNQSIKPPKVFFANADLDSGLGVRMDYPTDDSENDDEMTVHL
ncbi:cadherin-related family member 5 [Embiotoca jacksoni]|uniref:cadherin-related family member 5 n=1 Tax=Embiotoca jacksoni TaxID=100190 RepID=UPI00370370D1